MDLLLFRNLRTAMRMKKDVIDQVLKLQCPHVKIKIECSLKNLLSMWFYHGEIKTLRKRK